MRMLYKYTHIIGGGGILNKNVVSWCILCTVYVHVCSQQSEENNERTVVTLQFEMVLKCCTVGQSSYSTRHHSSTCVSSVTPSSVLIMYRDLWRLCSDFMDMLRRLISCRIIIIINVIESACLQGMASCPWLMAVSTRVNLTEVKLVDTACAILPSPATFTLASFLQASYMVKVS